MFTTLAFLLYRLALFCVMFVKEAKLSDFDGVGSLMLLDAMMTAISAIALSVVYSQLDDTDRPRTNLISIKPPKE